MVNPFIKVVNATIEPCYLRIGIEKIKLLPDETLIARNVDEISACSIRVGFDGKKMPEFNPFKNKIRELLKVEVNNDFH